MNREKSANNICIFGAKMHNLQNINLSIPRNSFIVFSGLSGSGKSSLAFDTIYAEGQRKFIESLTAYARQFLQQLSKPALDRIEGLSPTISIEQKAAGSNPRSTVGTQTEISDYLRLLFARAGDVHCYRCGKLIKQQSAQEIIEQIISFKEGGALMLFAPLIKGKKGEHIELFKDLKKEGFIKVKINNRLYELDSLPRLDKNKRHNIELLIDRFTLRQSNRERLTDSVELALKYGEGLCLADYKLEKQEKSLLFNQHFVCTECNLSYDEVEPRNFSFNSPYGACPACLGLGNKLEVDVDLVIPDRNKSILEGAIVPWRRGGRGYILYYRRLLSALAEQHGFSLSTPFIKLPEKIQRTVLYGSDKPVYGRRYEGVVYNIERLFNTTESQRLKEELSKYFSSLPCPECRGRRLKKESLAVKIEGLSIAELAELSVSKLIDFFSKLQFSGMKQEIARGIIKEILRRLHYLRDVGLDYLSLDRKSNTLSGGESQRIRLATQIGSGLVGVSYILDEPTIGLHPYDTDRLLRILLKLKDLGNTVIVVEHDQRIIKSADYIVDLGPGAGKNGGRVVYQGDFKGMLKSRRSLTAKYLNGSLKIAAPLKRRGYRDKPCIKILAAEEHNLKSIDFKLFLGLLVCVSGVSGSGKSTLINEILYKALSRRFYRSRLKPGKHRAIEGLEHIDKVIVIDQAPIGRTPRSNPATYTGLFTPIRELFSLLPESRMRGYKPGRFSFNVKGGRCENCKGDGVRKIEMHFLPEVYVSCDLCKGRRYNEQTLDIKYKGRNIAEVLDLTVSEALDLFQDIPKISSKLRLLEDVGLGYIHLGQSATTLSGGEAQRIKLSAELSRRDTGKTLYLLDEPTTGLHFADIERLLTVLQKLVDNGNTVLVIEHNLDVIKSADYVVDLGPGGGENGGRIVAAGSPEEVAKSKKSKTGLFLKEILRR
jgi:excinuclease ABC subunit A